MDALKWFVKYVGIQGVLAIGIFSTFLIMTWRGQEINPEFYGILGIIIGFYFAKNGRDLIDGIKNHSKGKTR